MEVSPTQQPEAWMSLVMADDRDANGVWAKMEKKMVGEPLEVESADS